MLKMFICTDSSDEQSAFDGLYKTIVDDDDDDDDDDDELLLWYS